MARDELYTGNAMRKRAIHTAGMTKIALLAAALSVSSYFVIPLPFTPIVLSMHTVMVNVTGLMLAPRHAAYTVLIYLFMGLIGMPVFAGASSGPGKLFGPTGGFYFGFLLSAVCLSLWKGKKNSVARYVFVTVGVGMPIQHLCAILWMCLYNGWNVKAAVWTVSLPFLLGDVLKCILSSVLGAAMNKMLPDMS